MHTKRGAIYQRGHFPAFCLFLSIDRIPLGSISEYKLRPLSTECVLAFVGYVFDENMILRILK